MRTTNSNKRATRKTRKNLSKREARTPMVGGYRKVGTTTSSIRSTGLFAIKFEPIPALDVMKVHNAKMPGTEIFGCLLPTYLNYCKLCDALPIDFSLEIPEAKRILAMYEHMHSLITANYSKANLTVDFNETKLQWQFIVYADYGFEETIYAFELEFLHFLEKMKSSLFQPMVKFCYKWLSTMNFGDWHSNGFLEYGLSILVEQAQEVLEDNEEDAREILECRDNYEQGKALDYMCLMKQWSEEPLDEKFVSKLKRTRVSPQLKFLKQWVLDGIELMNHKDAQPIQNFQFDKEFDEEDIVDVQPVDLDRLFVIVYDTRDILYQQYEEGINMDSQEFGAHSPMEWYIIDEDTTKPYVHSNWMNDVRLWMNKGFGAMNSFLDKKRINK